MIKVSSTQRIEGQTFGEYLSLPEYSNSFFKSQKYGIAQEVQVSDKMRIGSLVDGILLEPNAVDMSDKLYPVAKDIATIIRAKFGILLSRLSKQVTYTSIYEYGDLKLPVKGRVDMELKGKIVLDLKVTQSKIVQINNLIDTMKYDVQLAGYMLQAKCDKSALIIHSIPDKQTVIIPVSVTDRAINTWIDRIMTFGKV